MLEKSERDIFMVFNVENYSDCDSISYYTTRGP